MRSYFLLVVFICVASFLWSQEIRFRFEQQAIDLEVLNDVFSSSRVFKTNAGELDRYFDGHRSSSDVFVLDLGSDKKWSFYLEEVQILTATTQLYALTKNGKELLPQNNNIKTYKGTFTDGREGQLRLTVNGNFVYANIMDENESYFIEPLSYFKRDAQPEEFVFYGSKDVKPRHRNKPCFRPPSSFEKHEKIQNFDQRNGDCFKVKLAVLADYLMFIDPSHSGIDAVVNHVVAVMNNVETNYEYNGTQNFDNGINFEISELIISTCPTCDPLSNTTNPNVLLNEFSSWVDLGGFYHEFHAAHFWTDRTFAGPFIGLAFQSPNLYCNSMARAILMDWSTNAALLKTMVAHEIGHNFNGVHDTIVNQILSPSVSVTDNWSLRSKNSINPQINSQSSCLLPCQNTICERVESIEISNVNPSNFTLSWNHTAQQSYVVKVKNFGEENFIVDFITTQNSLVLSPPGYGICKNYDVFIYNNCSGGNLSAVQRLLMKAPVSQGCADFIAPKVVSWVGVPISLQDKSINATSWSWDFGNGQTSTLQNPTVTYTSSGSYDVTLTVNNGAHTTTRNEMIKVLLDWDPPYTLADGGDFESNYSHFSGDALDGPMNFWEHGHSNFGLSTNGGNAWKTLLNSNVPKVTTKSALYSPRFDFTAYENYTLSFDIGMQTTFCNAPLAGQIQYSVNNGQSWIRLGDPPTFYNAGFGLFCEVFNQIFSDRTGWTHNQNYLSKSIDVSFLSGQPSVIFRFVFSLSGIFNGGYTDGMLVDNFNLAASNLIPLSIVENSLNAEKEEMTTQLEWTTTKESDILEFAIMHSEDGLNWEFIDTIVYISSNNGRHFYTHYFPREGLNYYKILSVNHNGKESYTNVARVYFDKQPSFNVFPNPVKSGETISIVDHGSLDKSSLQLLSPTGAIWDIEFTKTNSKVSLPVLPSMPYIMRLTRDDGTVETRKLVVID